MKLGIDFGTTRIVVASADRGNYPLVCFESPAGNSYEWFPPLIAVSHGTRLFGWACQPVLGNPEWTIVRSAKRLLKDAGPDSLVSIGAEMLPVQELLAGLAASLRESLRTQSNLGWRQGEPLEVMLGVPANANSNQRFLTADAFRQSGFQVLGLLNEPSAASIEFGHRDHASRAGQGARSLLVYDLGGGTFDVSLVEVEGDTHTVLATAGIPDLGGDDFDEILADLAVETAGISRSERDGLSMAEEFRLYEECRERKESLNPNTRKIAVDLDRVREGWGEVTIAAGLFYDRCRPLVEKTQAVVEEMLGRDSERVVEALYVTGGGSELPAVSRVLKETFGRRVRRSSYMRSATAIGLAIAADARSGYIIRDRFAQYFGVWREADQGRRVAFDLLFPRGLELPRAGGEPLIRRCSYRAAHNIGHFRYVECSRLDAEGEPVGDLTVWDEVVFPFDPALRDREDLSGFPVARDPGGESWIEEEYSCDASGMLKVTIHNRSAGYQREYGLGRWSAAAAIPLTRRRGAAHRARGQR